MGQPPQKSYKDFNTDWPINSWSVTENSNGYQSAYIRLLSKFAVGDEKAGDPVNPTGSAGLLSRGAPAYASSGAAAAANDADYETGWSPGESGWLAYDLSAAPPDRRGDVVLAWYTVPDDGYTTIEGLRGVCPVWSGRPYLRDYVVEVNPAPGGGLPPSEGWIEAASGKGQGNLSAQLPVAMGANNWIRIRGSGPNGISVNVDVAYARRVAEDGWLFVGDSITAAYAGHSSLTGADGKPVPSFANLVEDATTHLPVSENGGMSCAKSGDARAWLDSMLDEFPGKYVALSFGTNDAWGGDADPETYYENMEWLVNEVIRSGKTPVVPTVPWPNNGGSWDEAVRALNAQVARLYHEHPDVIRGPDLYALFDGKSELFRGVGDVHPSEAGSALVRQAWAAVATSISVAD